jgi:predicted PurR-regulated permease PerM
MSYSYALAAIFFLNLVVGTLNFNFFGIFFARNYLNMNPVVMFFALLVGARIAGLVGVFLSIPLAGVLISLFEIEEMQGD